MAYLCSANASFDDLVGIPFLEGGRDPKQGVDCLGIVLLGLKRMGIEADDPWNALAIEWHRGWRPTDLALPIGWLKATHGSPFEPGDVLGVADQQAKGPQKDTCQHVALMLPGGLVLQSSARYGSAIFPLARLRMRVVGHWRWCGK